MTDLEVILISILFSLLGLIGMGVLGNVTHAIEEKNREQLRKEYEGRR